MPPPRRGSPIRTVLGSCLLVSLAACGGGSPTPTPGPRGIVFPASFTFKGALDASGTFIDSASTNTPTSCEDFGRAGIVGTYFIPSPPRGQKLNGQPLEYQSLVDGYHGPGMYTDVHALVQITAGDGTYTGGPDAALTLTARADGSGTVLFDRFGDVTDAQRRLSGRIDWTCRRAS